MMSGPWESHRTIHHQLTHWLNIGMALHGALFPRRLQGNVFYAVTTIPGTHNIWAAGTGGLAELWNGTKWKIIPTASVNSPILYGVVALSATDAWAVGNYYQGNQMPNAALVEHWNGSQWSQVPAAYPSGSQHTFLYGIAAFSATDVWTVGFYDNGIMSPGYTLVEHWTGKKWKLVSSPNPGSNNNVLGSVATIPGTQTLWAAGYTSDGANTHTLIEYWNGTAWSVSTSPSPGVSSTLLGVVALSAKSTWVVGSYTLGQGDDSTLTEKWNGTAWTAVSRPKSSYH